MEPVGHIDPRDLPPREIIEYLELPFHRPVLFLLPLLVVLVGAGIAYSTAPRKYTSATLIFIEAERVPDAFQARGFATRANQRLRTIGQEILSRTRLERVVKELDPYPQLSGKSSSTDIVERMRSAIGVRVKGGNSFYIEYSHTNPYLAMTVTNRLATLFIEETTESREDNLTSALRFIDTQLEQAKQSLQEKELALGRLKQKHIGSLPEQLNSNLAMLQSLQTEKQALAERIRATEDRRYALAKDLAEAQRNLPGQPGTRTTLSRAASELAKANELLDALLARYTDGHPDVRKLKKQIARLEEIVSAAAKATPPPSSEPVLVTLDPSAASAGEQLTKLDLDLLGMKRQLGELEQRSALVEQRVGLTPAVEQELLEITRDYNERQNTYTTLLQKKLDTEMAQKVEKEWKGERFSMLDPAFLPDRPSSPVLLKFLLGGLGLGLAAGIGCIVVAEALDHSVKNERELEVILPYPVLVSVPHVAGRRLPRAA